MIDITRHATHIFVLGDLVLDHAIFVEPKDGPYQAVGSETVYDVQRRIDTAGGAANCARILSSLGYGRTYLWGITGQSPWGSFYDILGASHIYDSARSNVHLLAKHDESIAMNTVTRIIKRVDALQTHEARFDDVGYVSLTQSDITAALDHLSNAYNNEGIDAIIINDLDMNAIDERLIKEVANFADQRQIPIFVDPKRDVKKYENISATAILPNFREWCAIVGEADHHKKWRNRIRNPAGLREIAQRSLQRLPNFEYHIIKCDTEGAIIIGPSQEGRHMYSVYHTHPHPAQTTRELPHQLGCGDVLVAMLALEYASAKPSSHKTDRILKSFEIANATVACYRRQSWHRMPTRSQVKEMELAPLHTEEPITMTAAARYVPDTSPIDLREVETAIPGLLSIDDGYRTSISNIMKFFSTGWEQSNLKSAILTARGGSGKTEICKKLPAFLKKHAVRVESFDDEIDSREGLKNTTEAIKRKQAKVAAPNQFLLLTVDEAFKRGKQIFERESGVLFLERAHELGVRFLFIDADYETYRKDLSESQFVSRCEVFQLPSISERPSDVIYLFVSGCFAAASRKRMKSLKFSRNVLLAVVDWFLTMKTEEQSARRIFDEGRTTMRNAEDAAGGGIPGKIQMNYLSKELLAAASGSDEADRTIKFHR